MKQDKSVQATFEFDDQSAWQMLPWLQGQGINP
jgi:hypothetical protein